MQRRWIALAIIFASFIQFTLNWFAIIPMFPRLAVELHLGPLELAAVAGAFFLGYGVFHLPGGVLAERIGMRRAMLCGILVESAGAALGAAAHGQPMMLFARFLCGAGGSIYIGSAVGLTTAWFRDRELATANGLITGVAFSLGASIGLFGWGVVGGLLGWRLALLAGAAIGLLTAVGIGIAYPEPPAIAHRDVDPHHGLASLGRVFSNARLWIMSVAFLGGYGCYFGTASILPGYAVSRLGATATGAEALGSVLLLAGIVGAFAGGWLADRVVGPLATFLIGCILEAAALLAVPFVGIGGLTVAAGLIGAGGILSFVSWIGLPGTMPDRLRASDVPTAVGLMLTVVAIGGAAAPSFYVFATGRGGVAAGWIAQAVVVIGFALVALLALRRRPVRPASGARLGGGRIA